MEPLTILFMILGISGLFIDCLFTLITFFKIEKWIFEHCQGFLRTYVAPRIRDPLLFTDILLVILIVGYLACEKLLGTGLHLIFVHLFNGELEKFLIDIADVLLISIGVARSVGKGVSEFGRSMGLNDQKATALMIGLLGYVGIGLGMLYSTFQENAELVVTIIQISAFSLFIIFYFRTTSL